MQTQVLLPEQDVVQVSVGRLVERGVLLVVFEEDGFFAAALQLDVGRQSALRVSAAGPVGLVQVVQQVQVVEVGARPAFRRGVLGERLDSGHRSLRLVVFDVSELLVKVELLEALLVIDVFLQLVFRGAEVDV